MGASMNLDQSQAWQPDVLGAGYESRKITLTPDEDPNEVVTATLVRAPKPRWRAENFGSSSHTDVLYVHGWSDYFFQTHLADFWRSRGARFYALDLRRYGRNLQPDTLPGYVGSLDVYDEEIQAALEVMGHGQVGNSTRKLVLLGHSTGGLVLSLWASRNPGRASSLILNSPWLELQTRELGRLVLSPVIDSLGRYQPKVAFKVSEPGFYMRTLSDQLDGEWPINLNWHPARSFPVYPGWLSAITSAQQQVANGLWLRIPTLVLLSSRSIFSASWLEEMRKSDTVLDVTTVAKRALNLGDCTTVVRIEDALHDVFLSALPIRERAFDAVAQWLEGYGSDENKQK